jgi:hypothetical protein
MPVNSHETPAAKDPRRDITIIVVHEDSGREAKLQAGPGTPVRTMIERAYSELGLERNPADRLRVESTGTNVLEHQDQHLGDFLKLAGNDSVWLLAGPTGGA